MPRFTMTREDKFLSEWDTFGEVRILNNCDLGELLELIKRERLVYNFSIDCSGFVFTIRKISE